MVTYDTTGIEEINVKDNCIVLRYKSKNDAMKAYIKEEKETNEQYKKDGVDLRNLF